MLTPYCEVGTIFEIVKELVVSKSEFVLSLKK